MPTRKLKYPRVLLKLSGEVLRGGSSDPFDGKALDSFVNELKKVQKMGCQLGIVIGGGNIWRFRDYKHMKMPRVKSDTVGMLATVMNTIVLKSALDEAGADVRAMSSLPCEKVMESYVSDRACHHLSKGRIVVFAGGTGSPFFTTDSAAALRALETDCDVLLKGTKVDYVYDKDPVKYKNAKKYNTLSYQKVIENNLGVMDLTCASLCKEGALPMLVFDITKKGNLEKILKGSPIGTIIN